MASAAQTSLAALEKRNAPIVEQIEQARLFTESLHVTYHGREEWAFRWLLKKLSAARDAGIEARSCEDAWHLLDTLIQRIPVRNAARMLNERKLIELLSLAIDELRGASAAAELQSNAPDVVESERLKISSGLKKRKRDGSPISQEHRQSVDVLRSAIASTMYTIVKLGITGASEPLEAEYMKSVLRTTPETAGRILGGWLASTRDASQTAVSLVPFLELWSARSTGAQDAAIFAKECLEPLLDLLASREISASMESQLERLLSRNIVAPARTSYASVNSTDMFKSSVAELITKRPEYANLIFSVTIRCVPPQANRRRKTHDLQWLQTVFAVLVESLESGHAAGKGTAIVHLLDTCHLHEIPLELNVLKSLVRRLDLEPNALFWKLIAVVIKLDSNVYLIADGEPDLLPQLLDRISKASSLSTWPELAKHILDEVLNPLMVEFAKGRKLVDFIRLWYKELIANIDPADDGTNLQQYTAWEHEKLQRKFKVLMETSLSTSQILELATEFTASNTTGDKGLSLVIIDAISGAITKEESIDAIGLQLCQNISRNELIFNDTIKYRFQWRAWRIMRQSLEWKTPLANSDEWLAEKSVVLKHAREVYSLKSEMAPVVEHPTCMVELFKCLTSQAFRDNGDKPVEAEFRAIYDMLEVCLAAVVGALNGQVDSSQSTTTASTLGTTSWFEDRMDPSSNEYGLFACDLANWVFVQNPSILNLTELSTSALRSAIWIASATSTHTSQYCDVPWLKANHSVFPSFLYSMLKDETVLNSTRTIGAIIDVFLDCGSHLNNPVEVSRDCNGYVVNCLLLIPIESFSKTQRERILEIWQPDAASPSLHDTTALSYRMSTLDPAVLSLKLKVMQRSTLYEGINFQDLVELGDNIAKLSDQPRLVLPIYGEMIKSTLAHIVSSIDQKKSRVYVSGALQFIDTWLRENKKAKEPLLYTTTRLVQTTLVVLDTKISLLESNAVLTTKALKKTKSRFKKVLVLNLEHLTGKLSKLKRAEHERVLSLYSALDGLESVQATSLDLSFFDAKGSTIIASLTETNVELASRVQTFLVQHAPSAFESVSLIDSCVVSTYAGRFAIQENVTTTAGRLSGSQKLSMTEELIKRYSQDSQDLRILLAVRHAILCCEDSKDVLLQHNDNHVTLSSLYSTLAEGLPRCSGFRQFCLLTETMEVILRTKSRVITQYNIDTTLASISSICSPTGPHLPPGRAGTIFLHVCHLFQAVLLSHRLKLQGHFHIVVQVLTSLLHTLFIPVSSNTLSKASFPPWSQTPEYHLTLPHAQSFTRLLTLICDPSTSSVSRSSSTNALNSATAKAKRLVGQHMPLVLAAYIKLQLDLGLRMNSEVREALVPGIWAVFDTMSVEGRRVLGESLDSSGRAVLAGLVRDWTRFGKWKGL